MKHLVVMGRSAEEIERYLGFSAELVESAPARNARNNDRTLAIVSVGEQDVLWQRARLSSGMLGNWEFDSYEEARKSEDWSYWALPTS